MEQISIQPTNTIRVDFEGKATKVDYYTIPTGSQTYLEQKCIGTVEVTDKEFAELEWHMHDNFLGYIYVLVYNGDVARTSNIDEFFIKAIYEK